MEKNKALCVVPEDQLSLAIGKEGQNVRLATKLTGWKIDVRMPENKEEKEEGEEEKKEEKVSEEKKELKKKKPEKKKDVKEKPGKTGKRKNGKKKSAPAKAAADKEEKSLGEYSSKGEKEK
jgi:N utilization substance protein A